MRDRLVTFNAAGLAHAVKVPRYQAKTLTPAQTERFLSQVQGDRLEALYVLATWTAMRERQLLGLR